MVWWWCGLEGVIHGRVEQAAALDAVGVGEQPRLDGGELRLVAGVGGGGGGDGRLCLVLEGGRGRRRCGQGRAAVGHLGGFRRAGRAPVAPGWPARCRQRACRRRRPSSGPPSSIREMFSVVRT